MRIILPVLIIFSIFNQLTEAKGIKVGGFGKVGKSGGYKGSSSGGHGGGGGATITVEGPQQPPQNYVFCGIQPRWIQGQSQSFFYRAVGRIRNIMTGETKTELGIRSANNPNIGSLIPLPELKISEGKSAWSNLSWNGTLQSMLLGYGCVHGNPSDLYKWYRADFVVPSSGITIGQQYVAVAGPTIEVGGVNLLQQDQTSSSDTFEIVAA